MSDERDYYRAEGESKALLADYFKKRSAATKLAEKLAKEYGAYCCIQAGVCKGFVFKGRLPNSEDGLIHRKRDPEGWYYPNTRSAAGRVTAARLGLIEFPDQEDVAIKLMGKREWVPVDDPRSSAVHQLGPREFRVIGGEYYVAMKAGVRAPLGCVLLKRSEFWAIVEADESKKPSKRKSSPRGARA